MLGSNAVGCCHCDVVVVVEGGGENIMLAVCMWANTITCCETFQLNKLTYIRGTLHTV